MSLTFRYQLLEKSFRLISRYLKHRIEGLENLPPRGEGYVAAANHRSFADAAILPQTLVTARNEPVHMVSYSELFGKPVMGTILRWAQGLVLDRSSREGIERFIRDAKYILTERHECVGLHPEAHIQYGATLGKGRPGAVHLGMETGCPVVPIALFGTDTVVPMGTKRFVLNFKRRALSFRAGKPMYFREYRKAYDEGPPRAKKAILDGCTTLLMIEIGKLTGQKYEHVGKSLERLKKYTS
jgi:1-acyl-sn-glycerol-3-phosphate acyltransferase